MFPNDTKLVTDMLKSNTWLQYLNLSSLSFDSVNGETMMRNLLPAMHKSLYHLELKNWNLSLEHLNILVEGMKIARKLWSVHLSDNDIGSQVANKVLKTLNKDHRNL